MKFLTASQRTHIHKEWLAELPFYQKRARGKGNTTFELATARNKLLINDTEQRLLARATVGFFGLSVGSHAALNWAMVSRAHSIKIADPDTIAATNLNRIRVGWSAVGRRKTDAVAQVLRDMLPDSHIYMLTHVDSDAMVRFSRQTPRVSCIVDEIDDIGGKVTLRKIARTLRVPLLSAVDVGENVFLDIERYDRKPEPQYFLGRLPGIESVHIGALTRPEKVRLIMKLVGLEHNDASMLSSLLAIGDGIATWPQLGSTAAIAGGLVASAIKRIVLGEPIRSGRYVFDMNAFLSMETDTQTHRIDRLRRKVMKRFGLTGA